MKKKQLLKPEELLLYELNIQKKKENTSKIKLYFASGIILRFQSKISDANTEFQRRSENIFETSVLIPSQFIK